MFYLEVNELSDHVTKSDSYFPSRIKIAVLCNVQRSPALVQKFNCIPGEEITSLYPVHRHIFGIVFAITRDYTEGKALNLHQALTLIQSAINRDCTEEDIKFTPSAINKKCSDVCTLRGKDIEFATSVINKKCN